MKSNLFKNFESMIYPDCRRILWIFGFSNTVKETWIWIGQFVELQNWFQIISNTNLFPGNWKFSFKVLRKRPGRFFTMLKMGMKISHVFILMSSWKVVGQNLSENMVLNEKLTKNGNYELKLFGFNFQYSTMITSAQIQQLLKYHVNFQSDSGHQDIVKINWNDSIKCVLRC